jgi:hypothetical protein
MYVFWVDIPLHLILLIGLALHVIELVLAVKILRRFQQPRTQHPKRSDKRGEMPPLEKEFEEVEES